MTRRDYERLAAAIHVAIDTDSRDLDSDLYLHAFELAANTVIEGVITACKAENPRFDAQRFREACRSGI